MSDVDRIYQKYISVFYEVDGGGTWIDLSAVRYALRAALREMADAGCQADRLIDMRSYNVQAKQIERLNDWLLDHAGDLAHDPRIDTADSMIAAADRLRGTVARQTIELAAAVEERNAADQACGKMEAELGILRLRNSELHEYARTNQKLNIEIDGLREQLAQMDADNGKLTHQLHASTAVATPHGNGTTDDLGTVITALGKTRTVPEMLAVVDAANGAPGLSWPGELADWVEGLEKGRRDWRKLAKSVRWQLIANVVNQVKDSVQFDAHKPGWMTSARAAALTFGDGRWDKVVERAHAGEVVL